MLLQMKSGAAFFCPLCILLDQLISEAGIGKVVQNQSNSVLEGTCGSHLVQPAALNRTSLHQLAQSLSS